jgi:hypothetical protein
VGLDPDDGEGSEDDDDDGEDVEEEEDEGADKSMDLSPDPALKNSRGRDGSDVA